MRFALLFILACLACSPAYAAPMDVGDPTHQVIDCNDGNACTIATPAQACMVVTFQNHKAIVPEILFPARRRITWQRIDKARGRDPSATVTNSELGTGRRRNPAGDQ